MLGTLGFTLINGQFQEHISADNRGLAYGDGLFETILVRDSRPLWLEDHLCRLSEAAKQLAIPCDLVKLKRDCALLLTRIDQPFAVLKIVLTRGHVSRGYTPHHAPSERIVSVSNYTQNRNAWERGVDLALCQTPLSEQTQLAGIKHLNRLEQVLAGEELLRRGYPEGLMMQRGLIVEGSRSNVFCVANDVLITPSLSQGGVRGIMRQHIIKHAIKLGIEVRIRDIGISTLQRAEEVFVCNSVFGLWPVKKIECIHKSIGPVSRLLQREFDTYFYV